MPSLKVGIHEWIVVELTMNNPIKLWTSGLIGCVAVAIITPTRAFVTHISSEMGIEGWNNQVKDEFSKVIGEIEDIDQAKECCVVGGENKSLYDHLLESIDGLMECKMSFADGSQGVTGLSAYWESYGPCIQLLRGYKDEPPLSGTLNSKTGAGHYKAQGFFKGAKGGAATLG